MVFYVQVQELLNHYKPMDRTDQREPENIAENLTCRCPKRKGVHGCEGGKAVFIRTGYWAGDVENNNMPEPWEEEDMYVWPVEEFVDDGASPGIRNKRRGVFDVVPCENGKCTRNASQIKWRLDKQSPCKKSLNNTGPLCGLCREGMTHVWASLVSSINCCYSLFSGCHVVRIREKAYLKNLTPSMARFSNPLQPKLTMYGIGRTTRNS